MSFFARFGTEWKYGSNGIANIGNVHNNDATGDENEEDNNDGGQDNIESTWNRHGIDWFKWRG